MSAPFHLSKFLSLVLRHKPDEAGITLDASGWCDIDALIAGSAAHGRAFTREELLAVVASNDKQRFAISDDGLRIRANQGHSVEVDLGLQPQAPPDTLFHGTVARFLDAIRREGLRKMSRSHVHLSRDQATAAIVGERRGDAIILRIDARAMHAKGHQFFLSANGVWLVEAVPPEHIDFPA
jgi:putative RNA 2'-phosphotransferase